MKLYRYIFIFALAVLAASCTGKKGAMGPEETVEAFNTALTAGDFETARALCDTVSMDDYLKTWRKMMNSLQKEDSCAFAIAAGMLAGAEFEVENMERDGDERTVQYILKAEGNTKTKKATVKKEEGVWKVTSITDAI